MKLSFFDLLSRLNGMIRSFLRYFILSSVIIVLFFFMLLYLSSYLRLYPSGGTVMLVSMVPFILISLWFGYKSLSAHYGIFEAFFSGFIFSLPFVALLFVWFVAFSYPPEFLIGLAVVACALCLACGILSAISYKACQLIGIGKKK